MNNKQTYHSNPKYKVCARISADIPEQLQSSVSITGNTLEVQDLKKEFKDKYAFSLNRIFTDENT